MTAGFTLRVFGMPMTVEFILPLTDEELETIARSWSRCIVEGASLPASAEDAGSVSEENLTPGPNDKYAAVLRLPAEETPPRLVNAVNFAVFQEALTSSVTLLAINARVGQSIMFHAAGLADPATGGAIALIAASGTGKTTASLKLGTSLNYLTDETVFLDGRDILPYPKPLSVIREPETPKEQVSPDDAGLRPTPERAPLRALALIERVDSLDEPGGIRVTRLGAIESLHALVPHMSGAPSLPHPLTDILELLEDLQGLIRITFENSADLLPTIRELLHTWPTGYTLPRVEEVPFHTEETPPPASDAPLYRRRPVRQAALVDDHLMVMLKDTLLEISELGEPIWSAAYGWRTIAEITAAVEDELGEHPDAVNIITQAVDELTDRGVLERVDAR